MKQIMTKLCDDTVTAEEKTATLESVGAGDITGEMLAACAQYLLKNAVPLEIDAGEAIDVCGTGGDKSRNDIKTFNISTAAAFVLAAGGVPVIKHGNKAVSSSSGSSDVLEALGVAVCTTSEQAKEYYSRHNLCFVAAPAFHPVLLKLAPVRKALGKPTFLNLLGPLCNPARTKKQLIGVFDLQFLQPMAEAARLLGKTDIMAVHSEDGLDELSISAPTHIYRLKDGKISREKISPEDAGIKTAAIETLRGGTAAQNAAIIGDIFSGTQGPASDIVCLNAAAGFVIAGREPDLKHGLHRARQVIADGLAHKKLLETKGEKHA
jgi:anthranilate phosphoribosyltransferase